MSSRLNITHNFSKSTSKERSLSPANLIMPLFIIDGEKQSIPVASMPGIDRFSPDLIVEECRTLLSLGIKAVALFPSLNDVLKDKEAGESVNTDGLLQRTIRAVKADVPEMCVITDVAMDPYSSDGHDGLVRDGEIVNDETLVILADMAVAQAKAGADMVAPSDMMDGRIGFIRSRLDTMGFQDVGIISYAAKYCSAFYGPFRDALDSAPKSGDKKTYQMNPANRMEALREVRLDIEEGADAVMVKPAYAYLDVIRAVADVSTVPVAAYHVSGEYAMLKAWANGAVEKEKQALNQTLQSIHRAGADLIFTYAARQFAEDF